jgi:hypothetical protein
MGMLMGGSKSRRTTDIIYKSKSNKILAVGGIMGFIYGLSRRAASNNIILTGRLRTGTVTIFQYGAGQAGVMRTLGKYMLGSGSMFGYVHLHYSRTKSSLTVGAPRLFMGIGSIIRTDSPAMASSVWARSQYPALVHQRQYPPSRR